eukprot:TRINITY_DN4445_c0_g1_i1.p1 TRINITY_DN4445_c0_g1~~TRINITY_DN4445_c0_g1_i1.p1  ORF type:complete len:126 (-),score=23.37 TRINITY_DN4445_c0_g1_i1:21-398(-)
MEFKQELLVPRKITIKIISGYRLPREVKAIKLQFFDRESRNNKRDLVRTKSVNGNSSTWNETFHFNASSVDVAMFLVVAMGDSEPIGHYAFVAKTMRKGYRSIPLFDSKYEPINDSSLLLHIKTL